MCMSHPVSTMSVLRSTIFFFNLWIGLLSHCPYAAVEEEEEEDENIHDSVGDSQAEQLNDASL